jgi:hypothetical protein
MVSHTRTEHNCPSILAVVEGCYNICGLSNVYHKWEIREKRDGEGGEGKEEEEEDDEKKRRYDWYHLHYCWEPYRLLLHSLTQQCLNGQMK